jgi:hypothetical protein
LRLTPSRLVIKECSVHDRGGGKRWIGLPGKPQLNKDGTQRKDPTTGKPLWVSIIEIEGKPERERFQAVALALAAVDKIIGGAP